MASWLELRRHWVEPETTGVVVDGVPYATMVPAIQPFLEKRGMHVQEWMFQAGYLFLGTREDVLAWAVELDEYPGDGTLRVFRGPASDKHESSESFLLALVSHLAGRKAELSEPYWD